MAKLLICIIYAINLALVFSASIKKAPDSTNQNRDNREPLFVPGRCPRNQLFYPGDQPNDWICDCAHGFLYHSADDKCYEMYRQGPCKANEYFILEEDETIPECVNNVCTRDGSVPFKNKCYSLYTSNACPPANSGRVLRVNVATLELSCVEGGSQLHIIHVPNNTCPRGSKRNQSGQCRREFPITA